MNIRIRTRASYFIIILNNSSKIYPRTFEKIRTPSLCYCPFLHQGMIENASRIFQPNYFTGSYDETCSVVLATFTNIDFISSVFVFRLANEAAASPTSTSPTNATIDRVWGPAGSNRTSRMKLTRSK